MCVQIIWLNHAKLGATTRAEDNFLVLCNYTNCSSGVNPKMLDEFCLLAQDRINSL